MEFPQNFLWGAATSAYQVEGNNVHSDWWEWEKRIGLKETSGEACRHYQLYEQDFTQARELGHNAHRFSIEWSRIEPAQGNFSETELEHYLNVVLSLKRLGLEPIVTLHHFTNPYWLAKTGGWLNKKAIDYFLRFTEKVVCRLCEHVRFWVTINEPLVYIYFSYILGDWPPQEKSFFKAKEVFSNLIKAHTEAYRIIQRIYAERKINRPLVGLAKNLQAFVKGNNSLRNRFAVYLRNAYFNFHIIERLKRTNTLDFIGINYYTRMLVDAKSWGLRGLLLDKKEDAASDVKKNSLGWDVYPQGLYDLLLSFQRFKLPLLILENGICTDDDNLRWDFIRQHLQKIRLAMEKGVNILGYIYWSLLDNYEWDKGFSHRFGLIEVDYKTYARRPRESAKKFAAVCRTGELLDICK
jgi:beta-glucosidase